MGEEITNVNERKITQVEVCAGEGQIDPGGMMSPGNEGAMEKVNKVRVMV